MGGGTTGLTRCGWAVAPPDCATLLEPRCATPALTLSSTKGFQVWIRQTSVTGRAPAMGCSLSFHDRCAVCYRPMPNFCRPSAKLFDIRSCQSEHLVYGVFDACLLWRTAVQHHRETLNGSSGLAAVTPRFLCRPSCERCCQPQRMGDDLKLDAKPNGKSRQRSRPVSKIYSESEWGVLIDSGAACPSFAYPCSEGAWRCL